MLLTNSDISVSETPKYNSAPYEVDYTTEKFQLWNGFRNVKGVAGFPL